MFRIVVRSKRDADAVKAMVSKFYPNWSIRVSTLHGARTYEKALMVLEDVINDEEFIIILLGKEDRKLLLELNRLKYPNVVFHLVPRARVRNARIEQLFHELEVARSMFRTIVTWNEELKAYVFSRIGGEVLENLEPNPAYDVFLALGQDFINNLGRVIGLEIESIPVLVRKFGGDHDIYVGKNKLGVLRIPDKGISPSGYIIRRDYPHISLSNIVNANEEVLNAFERISIKILENYRDWAQQVLVPWSGGKDSTVALLLAVKVFGKDKVKAIFCDTGLEFPFTIDYIDKISRQLDVEVIRVYAGIDREIIEKKAPLPTHDYRWCTGMKIEAIESKIRELVSNKRTLVVIGDRDAESEKRSIRPPIRILDENLVYVAPLKMWSTAHVQLYLIRNNVPFNPLYLCGFYRIGCYICPALRSWEVYVMTRTKLIYEKLKDKPLFREFISLRESEDLKS